MIPTDSRFRDAEAATKSADGLPPKLIRIVSLLRFIDGILIIFSGTNSSRGASMISFKELMLNKSSVSREEMLSKERDSSNPSDDTSSSPEDSSLLLFLISV